MKMSKHDHMTLRISAMCDRNQHENALFLAHPIDPDTGEELEQPSPEKKAELERDAEAFARWATFDEELVDQDDEAAG